MYKNTVSTPAKAVGTVAALLLAPFVQAFDLNEMLTGASEPYSGMQSVTIGNKNKPVFTAMTYHEDQMVRMTSVKARKACPLWRTLSKAIAQC